MPTREHLVLCGGVEGPKVLGRTTVRLDLDLHEPLANVKLSISDIARKLLVNIPDRLVDLLEIATYVYAADGAISRGGKTDSEMGARWRRSLRFKIPVREPALWGSEPVSAALIETLSFLSDEQYAFDFESFNRPPSLANYFDFPATKRSAFAPEEVVLFSGGLDSLAGAVEEVLGRGKRVALVSHRSAAKISSVQKNLVDLLSSRARAESVLHVPVLATLTGNLNREPTHRARSFLFAALGAVTARLFGINRIRFFENGIVSLNLPPVRQVVGARATRTTHPQALAGFRRIFNGVFNRDFDVTNPFMWLTKPEVIGRIVSNGCSDLIKHSRSCTRVRDMTTLHPHCGECSQCIDRDLRSSPLHKNTTIQRRPTK
jgi:7-cyano-7-deazaguanine synthase in queuosine biosynthesis